MSAIDSHYEMAQIGGVTDDSTQFQSCAGSTSLSSSYPQSFYSADTSVQLERVPKVPNSSVPQTPESLLPKDLTEFVLRLSQNEIDNVLGPINDNIVSSDTVFYIRDAVTDISLPISGDDLIKILRENGRTPSVLQKEKVRNKTRMKMKLLYILLAICLCLTVCTVVLLILHSYPSILNGPKPVIIIFGGDIRKYNYTGNTVTYTSEPCGTIELYYPYETKYNRILKVTMLIPRWGHVTGLLNDFIIIAGGFDDKYDCYRCLPKGLVEVELFNLHTEQVMLGPSLKKSRIYAVGSIFEQKFYICGGDYYYIMETECEYLESNFSEWKLIKPLNTFGYSYSYFSSFLVYDDSLYIFGFFYNSSDMMIHQFGSLMVQKYQPTTEIWGKANLSIPSCSNISMSEAAISDFSLFYFWNKKTIMTTCYNGVNGIADHWNCNAYKEDENVWMKISGMDCSKTSHTFLSYNSTIHGPATYVFGLDYTGTVQVLSNDGCGDRTKPCWSDTTKVIIGRMDTSPVVIL